jgi:tRNA(adenine34) deaminase
MSLALEQAMEAELAGEVPVGAVVVQDGVVIARGRNRTIEWMDPTAHAEVVALKEAAIFCGSHRMSGLQLFVTLEPCAMCSGAIFHSRIDRVVFGAADPKTGCAGSVMNLFAINQLNHHAKVSGGVLSLESSSLLARFFQRTRSRKSAALAPLREDSLRTPEGAFVGLVSEDVPSSFCFSSDGFRMHYRDLHPHGATKTILCLHDIPYWSEQMRPVALRLASSGYRTICPDLIGCGLSDKPKKPSWHSEDSHVRALLDFLSLLEATPSHIIALGDTANIALALVRDACLINTKVIRVQLVLEESSELASTRVESETPRKWTGVGTAYLHGLDPNSRKIVLAPYPDAGHAAVLRGSSRGSSVNSDDEMLTHLCYLSSPNLFELDSIAVDDLLSAVQRG